MTLNDLNHKYYHTDLRMVLRCIPDKTYASLLIYFHLIRLHCATKPDMSRRAYGFGICLYRQIFQVHTVSEPIVGNRPPKKALYSSFANILSKLTQIQRVRLHNRSRKVKVALFCNYGFSQITFEARTLVT